MLNLPQFVFINGPPGSGKSTLANLLVKQHDRAVRDSFAEPVRAMIQAVFFPSDGPIDYQHDLRDQIIKNSSLSYLAGISGDSGFDPTFDPTVRNVMINFSEKFMKPNFGDRVFGRLLFRRWQETKTFGYTTCIIDGSGFAPEAAYIVSQVGSADCHLIRLHREGHTFAGDSRGYISLPGVQSLDLQNSSSIDAMLDVLSFEFGTLPNARSTS